MDNPSPNQPPTPSQQPVIQPATPPPLPGQTNSPTSDNHLTKLLTIILLVVVVILLGGVFLKTQGANSPLKKLFPFLSTEQTPSPTPQPSEAIQNVPTTEPTTDSSNPTWQTYKNETANFSIPYPVSLQAKETAYPFGVTSIELKEAESASPDFQFLIFPKSVGKTIGQDFDTYYAMKNDETTTIKNPAGDSQEFTKVRNRTINELRAIEYTAKSSTDDPNEESEVGVYIEIGNNVFIVSTGESNKAILDSMLTEFKYPL